MNWHTATLFLHKLRELIAVRLAAEAPELLSGEIEIDESYFGGRRKGKRGRGAGGKVHAVVIPDAASRTLVPIVRVRVMSDSIVYTDSFSSHDVLDVLEFRHQRVDHSERFVDNRTHINGIENFWNQAERHLCRYNGIPRHQPPVGDLARLA